MILTYNEDVNMRVKNLLIRLFLLLGFPLSGANWVMAEENSDRMIEEIIVVSTKRAQGELAQNISRASTVVSADMMAQNNMADLIDVARMVPNAQFKETSTFPGVQRFWLRAVGVTFSVPNFDPAVGVYQDGIFVAQNVAAILDTYDQESIEILRGPQGSLFGRNTSVGAVVTRSKRPSDEFEFNAEVTVGEFDRNDYAVSVSGPISENLSGKLAVLSRNLDEGWVKNTAPGRDDIGEEEHLHIKGMLVWNPTDELDITFIAEDYQRDGDGALAVSLGTCDNGKDCHGLGVPARRWDETYDDEFPWGSHSDHEINKYIVEANWDVGHGIITSLTGFIDVDVHSGSQFEGIIPFIITTRLHIDQDQVSQELRYASTFSETFDITAGLYYFQQDLKYGEARAQGSRMGKQQPGISDLTNPFGLRAPTYSELDHEAFALFAEARWHLNDQWTVIAGGRYTDESKDVSMCMIYTGSCSGNESAPFIGSSNWSNGGGAVDGWDMVDDESWDSFSPKVAVEYRPQEDLLYYASATRGFRSGGFSFRAGAAELATQANDPSFRPAFYDRERVDSLEFGMKSDWKDNTIRVNATAFYQWWDGIQRNLQEGPVGNIIQRTANVEDSHVYGIELETNWIAGYDLLLKGDTLRFDISLGWADSGYDSDYIVSTVDLSDETYAAPHETAYLGVSYNHPVGDSGAEIRWRVSYFWQEEYAPEGVPRGTGLELYSRIKLLDASVQIASADDKWYARLFGKNLNDYEYYVGRVPFSSSFGVGLPANPKTWGLTIGYNH
tara:strand:+ start:4219 stop:6567 length:2349 start_codon:yes stop_codon:yes gene_type:complete